MKFKSKHPHYEHLHKKWTAKNKHITGNLFDKHLKHMALGSLGGLMLIGAPGFTAHADGNLVNSYENHLTFASSKNHLLAAELVDKLPQDGENLSSTQEPQVANVIKKNLGISVTAEIEGKRLNRTYGLIGAEQHLYRFPGDTIYSHAETTVDWAMYGGSGIAPGLGAWGYFAPSKDAMTTQDIEREKYYIAVQTFLSPGFSERVAEYRDFYKYRKMLVVNPKTGQAVVCDIADAGPAESTGKHLGGSPEVMQELGLGGGPRKGEVLYFFINDPTNVVPLGPVKANEVEGKM